MFFQVLLQNFHLFFFFFYLRWACWGAADRRWDKAMQWIHSATITRQGSLLILSIIYYRSIHTCVHTTILWRVEDTKHLSEHRACMRTIRTDINRKEQEGHKGKCIPKAVKRCSSGKQNWNTSRSFRIIFKLTNILQSGRFNVEATKALCTQSQAGGARFL